MDENVELLEYIYKNADMGVSALTDLLKELKEKDNKIKKIIEDQLKEYEKFLKDSKKILNKKDLPLKENGTFAKLMSKIGIKKEVIADNSDASIAHMLTQGLTMGIIEMTSKIDNYNKTADKKFLKLAKDFKNFQTNSVEKLKEYL